MATQDQNEVLVQDQDLHKERPVDAAAEVELQVFDNAMAKSIAQVFNGEDGNGGINGRLFNIFITSKNSPFATVETRENAAKLFANMVLAIKDKFNGYLKSMENDSKKQKVAAGAKWLKPSTKASKAIQLLVSTPYSMDVIEVFEMANQVSVFAREVWLNGIITDEEYENRRIGIRKSLHNIEIVVTKISKDVSRVIRDGKAGIKKGEGVAASAEAVIAAAESEEADIANASVSEVSEVADATA